VEAVRAIAAGKGERAISLTFAYVENK